MIEEAPRLVTDIRTGAEVRLLLRQARDALDASPDSVRAHLDELERLISRAPLPLIPLHLPPSAARGGLAVWQMRRVDAHIDRHLGQGLKVGMLAALLDFSCGHFSRAFKASRGEAPQEHIIRRRVRAAQVRMMTTGEPLSDIAAACGFTDQAHMTRMFRRLVGQPPSVWRRAHDVRPGDLPAPDGAGPRLHRQA